MKKIIFLASLFMALNIKAAGPFIGYVQIATSTVKQSGGFNVQSGTTTNFNSTNANFSSVQIGGTVFSSSQTITTNTTWTGDHFVSSGSIVFINAGVTLTVNGTITAGAYQIFSGPGSVVFGNNFSGTVLPEWWGALCNGVNDDAIAIQAAINSISPIHGGIVQLSARQYTLKTPITINATYCLTIQGTTIGMSPYDSGGGIVSGTQLIGTNGVNGFVTWSNAYLTIKDLQIMLLSPATTACTAIGISVSSFLVKVLNVRVTYYSTAIKCDSSTDIYIDRCYLAGFPASALNSVGIDFSNNSSIFITNVISAEFNYDYWLHGNIIADAHLINCEGDGPTVGGGYNGLGLFIDGTAGLNANLSADIFVIGCTFDSIPVAGYGIHILQCNGNTIINIDNCWISEGACGILINNSSGVNITGCQIYGVIADYPTVYLNTGVLLEGGSTNCNISNNHIYYPYYNGIYLIDSPGNIISKNIIVEQTAAAANAIYLTGVCTNCSIIGNFANGIAGSFGNGIYVDSTSDYNTIIGNVMPSSICTYPFTLNQSSNVHSITANVGTGTIIPGTQTNDSANPGFIGERIKATATNVAMPASGNWGDAASISLTAGDWDVSGILQFVVAGVTATSYQMGISAGSSGNNFSDIVTGDNQAITPPSAVANPTLSIPAVRISLSAPHAVYLKMGAVYTGGSPTVYGRISARRVR